MVYTNAFAVYTNTFAVYTNTFAIYIKNIFSIHKCTFAITQIQVIKVSKYVTRYEETNLEVAGAVGGESTPVVSQTPAISPQHGVRSHGVNQKRNQEVIEA